MFKPADWVVVLAGAALVVLLAVVQWQPGRQAHTLVIHGEEGRVTRPLDRDGRERVAGPLGESVIEVVSGRARFIEAPCRNRVCIQTGWVEHDGELAACLPNRVTIHAAARTPRYDAINY